MFDLHVHSAPDLVERGRDDFDTVAAYRDAGYDGCVLKCHNEPTGGRARLAAARTGFPVYGSVVLNRAVGGINPVAVAVELALGARVVWMPTEDSALHRRAQLPRATATHRVVGGTPPVRLRLGDPDTREALAEVLQIVADADAVLATGHLDAEEIGLVLSEAARFGVTRILLTHPSWSVPDLTCGQIAELASLGAKVEITAYQLYRQPGMTPSRLAEVARSAGEQLVLSSDAGHPGLPSPPVALDRLVEALVGEGLDRAWMVAAASSVPSRLVVP